MLKIPRTQAWNPNGAPCFDWKFGLVLEGPRLKIEDKQVPSIYTYVRCIYIYIPLVPVSITMYIEISYGRFDSPASLPQKNHQNRIQGSNSHGLGHIETSLSFGHLVPVRQQISNTFSFGPLHTHREKNTACGSWRSLLLAKNV